MERLKVSNLLGICIYLSVLGRMNLEHYKTNEVEKSLGKFWIQRFFPNIEMWYEDGHFTKHKYFLEIDIWEF